ncbi:MAG: S8 family serine peptidase [Gammaproteobacteria bacterium]|nr:S8 family serine peptidase [Gammaproteobacteria bacterium]
MLLKKRALVAALAGLYSFGAGAAATHASVSDQPLLKAADLSAEAVESMKRSHAVKRVPTGGREMVGVNRHLGTPSAKTKYVRAADESGIQTYIVRLKGQPSALYDGSISGLKATSPRFRDGAETKLLASNKLVTTPGKPDSALNAYRSYLKSQQSGFLSKATATLGAFELRHQMTDAINAITVRMTPEQAERMAKMGEVVQIQRSKTYQLHTDVGPQHIGAAQIWDGSVTKDNLPYQGEGVLVGVIDTGINTDHRSFKATGDDGYAVQNPLGSGNYLGDCAKAEFAALCNDKLIGVRSYEAVTDTYDDDEFQDPNKPWWEPNVLIRPKNGEDYAGHGSHTASTAAGNVVTDVPYVGMSIGAGDGEPTGFSMGRVSGVAPHANVVAYQVCYPVGGCPGEAILAGIEDAVRDGVDVINFSIGGMESFPWEDAFEMAFLAAREANIAVAVSAGNSGPGAMTTDHSSPWLLSVAAASNERIVSVTGKSLTGLSGGDTTPPETLSGKGISGSITGDIVLASNYGDELCLNDFPAGTFTANQIVVCKRGENARVEKAVHVKAGGAGGFVLYNAVPWGEGSEMIDDVYALPGIQLDHYSGTSLVTWLSSGTGHQGAITTADIAKTPVQADIVASFSSRGPAATYDGHITPSVGAPGTHIYAAYADEHPFDAGGGLSADWSMLQGTSMASPHVAGAMALLRQAHPDWTAAEVQSALQSTATPAMTKPFEWSDITPAGLYDAGFGIINVAKAVQAGLVFDEKGENYRAANPNEGGRPSQLNAPELVDLHCAGGACTFVRSVRATRDGTWTATVSTEELAAKAEVLPAQFSLKAGQTQNIVVKVDVKDLTALGSGGIGGSAGKEIHGLVKLTPADASMPEQRMPMVFAVEQGSMPLTVNLTGHADSGRQVLKDIGGPAISALTTRTYALTAPLVDEEISLKQPDDYRTPFQRDNVTEQPETFKIYWVDVPEDAKRLVAEIGSRSKSEGYKEAWERGDADVVIGFDANGDGEVQPQAEGICISTSEFDNDFCNINKPEAGRYWVIVYNFQHWGYQIPTDTYPVRIAVVGSASEPRLGVSGPASTDGINKFDLTVNWDVPELAQGKTLFGGFDVGTDAGNPGNLGFVPVKLTRGVDGLSLATSQSAAKVGDVIDFRVHLLENTSGAARDVELAATLPEGLSLVPGSVKLKSALADKLTVDGSTISLAYSQEDSSTWKPAYAVTTSQTDAQCRTPDFGPYTYANGGADGGYVELDKFGIEASPVLSGTGYQEPLRYPLSALFGDDTKLALFNNFAYASFDSFSIATGGWLQIDTQPKFFNDYAQFPYFSFSLPYVMVAGLWRESSFLKNRVMGTPYVNDWFAGEFSGVSLAGGTAEYRDGELVPSKHVIVDWRGSRSQEVVGYDWMTGEFSMDDKDDRFRFQVIMNPDYRFGDDEPEIVMAYHSVEFGGEGEWGSVGLNGYAGGFGGFGPVEGTSGVSFAFDDLSKKLSNGLVVCYDYVGPESTQVDIRFQARVNDSASGEAQVVSLTHNIAGVSEQSVTKSITVNGNLKLAGWDDQVIDEDEALEGLMLAYTDLDTGANTVTVSGEHITGVVHGHSAGSSFDVIPDVDFNGETTVTVTVADNLHPNDKSAQSFKLTVNPKADAPTAAVKASALSITQGQSATLDGSNSLNPDGDATITWTGPGSIASANALVTQVSGLSVGSHEFTLTLANGEGTSSAKVVVTVNAASMPAPTPAPSSGGGGGGSFPLLGLVLLPLLALRRKPE